MFALLNLSNPLDLSRSSNPRRSLILFGGLIFSVILALSYCTLASEELSDYQGNSISFQYPSSWTVSQSGSNVAGNISLTNSCSKINLMWMRDPGFSPESIFDQIRKVYDQDEVEVVSSSGGEITVSGKKAKTLELLYKFKEYSAKRHFAVWRSNESDRLFLLSASDCPEEESFGVEGISGILATFKDSEDREVSLEPRSSQEDEWAILLGDLLASYHYHDQSAVKSMSIYVEAIHSLIPKNGSYSLFSEEMIHGEMPENAVIRTAVVQDILMDFGYDTKIIQGVGKIWIAVLDPSSKWQSISLNPKEPWRMLGVLTNKSEGYQGLIYNDTKELVDDNWPKVKVPLGFDSYVQKDVDPSRHVQLERPNQVNKSWADELQGTLDSYSYPQKYQENIFDCSNTSQISWAFLEAKGYDARLMFSYKDHPLGQHMWVVVRYPYEEESYVAVEATNANGKSDLMHLGKLTFDDKYYHGIMFNTSMQYSWLHPEEGMWLVPEHL